MACCSEVEALVARHARFYALAGAPIVREVERRVLGCDYGGTSWTTRDEAQRIVGRLALGAGSVLLDIGAGSGWPALYFARQAPFDVVLVDLPLSGMRAARDRAAEDGLARRCRVAVADGTALPFTAASFDAVSHSDVLCCLPRKGAMLQECRRVARPRARMVFSVIELSPGLSTTEHEVARASGPAFVDAPAEYATLLEQTGWRTLERSDVTAQFERTIESSVAAMETHADELVSVMGKEDFADRLQHRRATLTALARGLLKRELFVAEANPPP